MTMKEVEHAHATYDTPHLNAAVGVFALLANPEFVKVDEATGSQAAGW